MTQSDLMLRLARKAIERARRRASETVTADDLLVGALLLLGRFGVAVIGGKAIDLDALDADLPAGRPAGPGPAYDDSAVRVLERAAQIATRDGAVNVEVVHALVSFAYESEGLAAELRTRYGLTPLEWRAAFATAASTEPISLENPSPAPAQATGQALFTTEQAADYLGVHPQTIRSYIRAGKLSAYRIGGERKIRIRREDLLALLEPVTVEDLESPG